MEYYCTPSFFLRLWYSFYSIINIFYLWSFKVIKNYLKIINSCENLAIKYMIKKKLYIKIKFNSIHLLLVIFLSPMLLKFANAFAGYPAFSGDKKLKITSSKWIEFNYYNLINLLLWCQIIDLLIKIKTFYLFSKRDLLENFDFFFNSSNSGYSLSLWFPCVVSTKSSFILSGSLSKVSLVLLMLLFGHCLICSSSNYDMINKIKSSVKDKNI